MSRYGDHSDSQLLRLLRESDERAFEEIYRRYAAELNRFAFAKTGSREDGDEIIQELFVWVWTNRSGLERINDVRRYLFHAAKNRILSYYRAADVRERYVASLTRFNTYFDNTVEEHMNVIELNEIVEKSLRALPEKCQTAFRLSRMNNMSISGIAEEMAISRRSVENYISQALRYLRKKVETRQ